ncbi:hypothetical protein [Guptibacillus algicola]|uniref:hypothetical protein n=1 Tax=Guptibacillus algicola TaxID=225844 RepID=UPI001CD6012C|nr:hypothetical protein [Alkalihalobacillus algicola]MCA0987239.1 hypothetical protein [Alkalihalobacillus algicola]
MYGSDSFRPAVANVPVQFDFSGPIINTNPNPGTDSLNILVAGTYEISAGLNAAHFSGGAVNYDIRVNNVIIPGSRFGLSANASVAIGKTIQFSFLPGNAITVVPSSVSGTNTGYFGPALTANRIGP